MIEPTIFFPANQPRLKGAGIIRNNVFVFKLRTAQRRAELYSPVWLLGRKPWTHNCKDINAHFGCIILRITMIKYTATRVINVGNLEDKSDKIHSHKSINVNLQKQNNKSKMADGGSLTGTFRILGCL